jgi:Bifunctional DNA primase/polymerase, N-terminal/AAA domain
MERAALALAARGYFVFPCRPHTKEPFKDSNGLNDATRDERKILQWWDKYPDANPAINCGKSGVVVQDIDSKAGADPREIIDALSLENYPTIWTGEAGEPSADYPASLEGVRGAHVVFRGELSTGKTTIPGVEIRGVGAYVIAPPSVHPSGVEYEGEYPPVASLPAADAAGLDLILANGGAPAPVPGDDEVVEPGGRHEALLAWARSRFTAKGVLGRPALDGMMGHNASALRPPLPAEEVERLWRHLEGSRIAASERAKDDGQTGVSHVSPPIGERDSGTPANGRFTTRPVDLSQLRPVRFLWRPWLIHGRLNLLAGEEAIGKSSLQGWLGARMTRGELPGEFFERAGDVLYVGADEDDWYEAVTPRLYAMGADLARVREFVPVDDAAVFNVVEHIAELDRELRAHPFALVVFEQLMDVLPIMRNPTDPVEIRRALRPLRRVLAARDVTGLGTLHVNKAQVDQLRQRMQGSMQFGALSRSTILVDRHPDDAKRRVAVLGKANYVAAPVAMSFRLESHTFDMNGRGFDIGRVADVQDDDTTVEEVLARRTEREREHEAKRDAVADALTDSPQSVRAIGDAAGVPKSTTDRILRALADDGTAEQTDDGWLSHVPLPYRGTGHGTAQLGLDDDDPEGDAA